MEPAIITKKFLLAGYGTPIDLYEDFGEKINTLRARMRQPPSLISHRGPERPIGFWTGDPAVDYSDPRNHSRRMYFFGVEAARNRTQAGMA